MLLRKHLERGGGLLMFWPGRTSIRAAMQAGLFNATAPRGTGTPLRPLRGADRAIPTMNRPFSRSRSSTTSIRRWRSSRRGEIDYFGTARLYRYLPLTLCQPAGGDGQIRPARGPASAGGKARRRRADADEIGRINRR